MGGAPRYLNGRIPRDALVLLGTGWNADGYWEHLATPGTAAKIVALIRLGLERKGRLLEVSPGYNIYRPLAYQELAKKKYGRNAAAPGFSSHGGYFEGAETLAVDFSNWLYVWGSIAAFYDACREVGLEPGYFDWEPWHAIDRDPWRPVAASNPKEEPDMEAYVKVGVTILHLFRGGQYAFTSQEEYEAYRADTIFLTNHGGFDALEVPELSKVAGISQATYNRLRANFGIPEKDAIELIKSIPKAVMDHQMVHPVTGKPTTVGEILRHEPAEHANTHAALEKATAPVVDVKPVIDAMTEALKDVSGVDLDAVRAAAREGAESVLNGATIQAAR